MCRNTVAVIAVSWLVASILAVLTGHAEALPIIGRVLIDVLDALLARPLGELVDIPAGR